MPLQSSLESIGPDPETRLRCVEDATHPRNTLEIWLMLRVIWLNFHRLIIYPYQTFNLTYNASMLSYEREVQIQFGIVLTALRHEQLIQHSIPREIRI